MFIEIKPNVKVIFSDISKYNEALKYRWQQCKEHGTTIVYTRINGKKVKLLTLLFHTTRDNIVKFKNGNIFDFSDENVQIYTRSDYSHIISKGTEKSTYKNVHYNEKSRLWAAIIIKDGKSIFGGTYYSDKEAAIVADYLNYCNYGESGIKNFKDMTIDDIKREIEKINKKYGSTMEERTSRKVQGIKKKCSTKSKYCGVHPTPQGKWSASISYKNKKYYLHNHATEEAAAKAYDKKALELYGDSAKLNFPSATKT